MKIQERPQRTCRGMTMAEVVIAIGVVAFTIPLIIAAMGTAYRTGHAAEADTRSAWLAREVQHLILTQWSHDPEPIVPFPESESSDPPAELFYDANGVFISASISQNPPKRAAYLVTVRAEPYPQPQDPSAAMPLALVFITIQHPANAAAENRSKLNYRFVSYREGAL